MPAEPPANPTEAIAAWHAALEDGSTAEDSAAWLTEQLQRRGLFFGTRPLCNVLRPRFLSPAQYALLQSGCAAVLRALGTAFEAALEQPDVMRQFRLEAWEEELVRQDPDRGPPNPLARVDAFFDDAGETFRLTELNGETPAGPAYVDALADVFLTMPVARAFLREWLLQPLPVRHRVLQVLLSAWDPSQTPGRSRPVIAIVDWRDVPTRSEFVLFQAYFAEHGLTCVIADPAELDYRAGQLHAAGVPVDLVYKRVLLHELVGEHGTDHPLLRAVRDGAVAMVNGFRCKVLHKKAALAVLSDERNERLFDAEATHALRAYIPWTRVVEERTTRFEGRTVDLVPFVVEHRDRFVIKPNDDYGGTGVVLGWEVDAARWEAAVRQALERPAIVQARIALPSVPFPAMVEGSLTYADRIVDTAPFAFGGVAVEGCLTRISTDSLVNVTAGGGSTLATFVVDRRGA